MPVGYICAVLRENGHSVTVLSPLAVGVNGYPRDVRSGPFGLWTDFAKHISGTTSSRPIRRLRRNIVRALRPTNADAQDRILAQFSAARPETYDIVLLSTYSMFRSTCVELCKIAREVGVPVVAGGPLFSHQRVVDKWLEIDGLTGVFSGEPEEQISDLVAQVGSGTPNARVPGYRTRTIDGGVRPPVADLDAIPFPDYTDFPWDKYPNRIIPMMTGRGCGWGTCTFCSDVVTSSGRKYRSRSLGNVLDELRVQHDRHDATLFTFLDLKLNSNLEMWRGLAEQMQSVVPGAEWIAAIHSEREGDDGLSAADFKAARKAGLIRLTTGLESGSQMMLNAMAKGNTPERLSQTIRYASEAGISVRLTCIVGYPGETDADVRQTRDFLNDHAEYIDRVSLNRFALQFGTPAETLFLKENHRMTVLDQTEEVLDDGLYDFHNATFDPLAHKREMFGILKSVHNINRQPLSQFSKQFEGVM